MITHILYCLNNKAKLELKSKYSKNLTTPAPPSGLFFLFLNLY